MDLVKDCIGKELALFEKRFESDLKGSNLLLDKIMKIIIKRKGKQMRPMFVFLSAKIAGAITDQTYRAASLIELLHTATLVHDDVVDNASVRRSFFSINALWKNKIAVLVGDYLLAKGLLLSVEYKDYELLQLTSRAVKELSEGELLQMEKARKLDITEEVYYDIIRSKTASLLASACAAGAFAGSGSEDTSKKFWELGEYIGMAFQIKDDLFDYGTGDIGKPTGIDIKEKKMTLPLIYTLQQVDRKTRKKIIYIVKNENTNKQKVAEVVEIVQQSGGISFATQKMEEYIIKAKSLLHSFENTKARQAMEQLIDFVIERKY